MLNLVLNASQNIFLVFHIFYVISLEAKKNYVRQLVKKDCTCAASSFKRSNPWQVEGISNDTESFSLLVFSGRDEYGNCDFMDNAGFSL